MKLSLLRLITHSHYKPEQRWNFGNIEGSIFIRQKGNTMELSSKLPEVGLTIFAKMTGLANKHGAVNLSQGFPEADIDSFLIDSVKSAIDEGFNQYSPMPGTADLLEALSRKTKT